mgnify:CR=1 FL=1
MGKHTLTSSAVCVDQDGVALEPGVFVLVCTTLADGRGRTNISINYNVDDSRAPYVSA